jgi:hypothetical protein
MFSVDAKLGKKKQTVRVFGNRALRRMSAPK